MTLRPAGASDAPAVARIYGHHVLHGAGTFEETPPTAAEIVGRMAAVGDLGLPYWVAEEAGQVVGFAYAAPFRTRAAYRYAVEDSVYISPDRMGQGLGKALLSEVIARCEALGLRQMVALIGDSANAGSIGLHRSLSFREIGVFRAVGLKHGRWLDVVMMQRGLNDADASDPDWPGLAL
jgi:phosphinothricin acetyltransferase